MKIVIAPDSFKESLSAKQVAQILKQGFEQHFPTADYRLLPIADGGEGTLEAIVEAKQGQYFDKNVMGPLGQQVQARWGHFVESTQQQTLSVAVIELAQASGIGLVPPEQRDVMRATSYGTGELIREALDFGVQKVILCLGGSATNDAGAGVAQALGVRFLDEGGNELELGGAALSRLHRIDCSNLHPQAAEIDWQVACDVTNPLCGEQGASAVFGPQKGATASQVASLDAALQRFSDVALTQFNIVSATKAGFGAAGGTPLGLSVCGKIELKPGIDIVLDAVQLEDELDGASLVLTGEGQMDYQTRFGKAPFGVAKRAKARNIPVIGFCGSLGQDLTGLEEGFDAVFGTVRAPLALAEVLSEAPQNLLQRASSVAAVLALTKDF